MTPRLFEEILSAMHGALPNCQIAHMFGADEITVERWLDGTEEIPDCVQRGMYHALLSKSDYLLELADEID